MSIIVLLFLIIIVAIVAVIVYFTNRSQSNGEVDTEKAQEIIKKFVKTARNIFIIILALNIFLNVCTELYCTLFYQGLSPLSLWTLVCILLGGNIAPLVGLLLAYWLMKKLPDQKIGELSGILSIDIVYMIMIPLSIFEDRESTVGLIFPISSIPTSTASNYAVLAMIVEIIGFLVFIAELTLTIWLIVAFAKMSKALKASVSSSFAAVSQNLQANPTQLENQAKIKEWSDYFEIINGRKATPSEVSAAIVSGEIQQTDLEAQKQDRQAKIKEWSDYFEMMNSRKPNPSEVAKAIESGEIKVEKVSPEVQSIPNPAVNNLSQDVNQSTFGWSVLGFFIPLAGLICFLIWHNDVSLLNQKKGSSAGKGALVGVIVSVALTIIYVIVIGVIVSNMTY